MEALPNVARATPTSYARTPQISDAVHEKGRYAMAIVVEQAGSTEMCSSCGQPAVTKVRFQGPAVDKKAGVLLCRACGGLVAHLLIEEIEPVEPTRYVS